MRTRSQEQLSDERTYLLTVPFVAQRTEWDCGTACAAMALAAAGLAGTAVPALDQELPDKAAWTIDLAHLLARHGLIVTMHTTLAGAHADYAGVPFYSRDFEDDWPRVVGLFKDAEAAGISVQQTSLGAAELHEWLRGGAGAGARLAIALVDKHVLAAGTTGPSYQGHFVLLCGCASGGSMLAVMDPADDHGEPHWVAADLVQRARQVFGTDEDVLLVELPTTEPMKACHVSC